ncbi:hypothetical protein ACWGB8_01760 [Kitasatospora sp. NPDC054939]
MGWASATGIFNPVAQALIDSGATDELKTRVLGELIGKLLDGDWDTEHESLNEFKGDPAIVAAFRLHGVHLTCEAETDTASCELEAGHVGDHLDYQGNVIHVPASHAATLRPDSDGSDTILWQVHCPRCADAGVERGLPGEDEQPARADADPGRARDVWVDMYCAAGHVFHVIVANRKGAEFIGIVP